MICNICKDRVATIHLKEIIDNVVTELNMCEACYEAREQQGASGAVAPPDMMVESLIEQAGKKGGKEAKPLKCPICGITSEQFRAKGRLGCSDCYRVFAESLIPVLSKVHGSTAHRGKVPHRAARTLDLKKELRQLQEDLQKAIMSENYERAAKLRDRIQQFENMK